MVEERGEIHSAKRDVRARRVDTVRLRRHVSAALLLCEPARLPRVRGVAEEQPESRARDGALDCARARAQRHVSASGELGSARAQRTVIGLVIIDDALRVIRVVVEKIVVDLDFQKEPDHEACNAEQRRKVVEDQLTERLRLPRARPDAEDAAVLKVPHEERPAERTEAVKRAVVARDSPL